MSRSRLPFDFNMGPSEAQAAPRIHREIAGPCSRSGFAMDSSVRNGNRPSPGTYSEY